MNQYQNSKTPSGPGQNSSPSSNRNSRGRNDRKRHRSKRGSRNRKSGGGPKDASVKEIASVEEIIFPVKEPKRYGYVCFDTFFEAKANLESIKEKAATVDQLNIVIKAEGDQNDPDLCAVGVLFAGAAWYLIHTRRIEEGWYNEPR